MLVISIKQRNYRKNNSHMNEVEICLYILDLTEVSEWTDGGHWGTSKLNTETHVFSDTVVHTVSVHNCKLWAGTEFGCCKIPFKTHVVEINQVFLAHVRSIMLIVPVQWPTMRCCILNDLYAKWLASRTRANVFEKLKWNCVLPL